MAEVGSGVLNGGGAFEPRVRPIRASRAWLLGLAYWIILLPLTYPPRHSGNVWSRYMTAESLVERGTLAIDRSPLRAISGSPDLIKVGPHFYSDKPPMLSVLGAGLYAPLWLAGLRMSRPGDFAIVNTALVWALASLGSALAVVGVRRLLQAVPVGKLAADALSLVFGFSSLLLVYGVTFNNHSVAAGLLTMAVANVFLDAAGAGGSARARRGEVVTGTLVGLATAVDLPAGGVMAAALFGWQAIRFRSLPTAFLAGCVMPVLAAAGLQILVSGSALPVEMNPRLFDYAGSYWGTEAGRWVEPGPRWRFGLELLFGPQGWLTVTPVLLPGLAGIAWIATRRAHPLRPLAIVLAGAIATLLAYYTWGVRRTDFAGLSFGVRHFLAISPPVFVFAVLLAAHWKARGGCLALAALLGIGMVYSVAGMKNPWSRVERRDDSGLRVVKPLAIYPWSSYMR